MATSLRLGQAVSSAGQRKGSRGIRLIAAFKFAKAGLLLVIALGAVGLMRDDVTRLAHDVVRPFASGAPGQILEAFLDRIARLTPGRMRALGAGVFAYSALYLVEGAGLWQQRRWAEYLTVIATLSFVPFEVYEIIVGISAVKITALALNAAMVAYLSWLLLRRRVRPRPC